MKTISNQKAVIENSVSKPEVDFDLLASSIRELIILHMDGKRGKDQVIFDDVVCQLKSPQLCRRCETMTHEYLISAAIDRLVEAVCEI